MNGANDQPKKRSSKLVNVHENIVIKITILVKLPSTSECKLKHKLSTAFLNMDKKSINCRASG